MRLLILIACVAALGYFAWIAGETIAKVGQADSMTLYFECVDDMNRNGVDALEGMSFCKGILNEGR